MTTRMSKMYDTLHEMGRSAADSLASSGRSPWPMDDDRWADDAHAAAFDDALSAPEFSQREAHELSDPIWHGVQDYVREHVTT